MLSIHTKVCFGGWRQDGTKEHKIKVTLLLLVKYRARQRGPRNKSKDGETETRLNEIQDGGAGTR